MGRSIAPEIVNLAEMDDDDDDEVSILHAKPINMQNTGGNSKKPIAVKTYSGRKSKRFLDLSQDYYSSFGVYFDEDDDDIRVIDVDSFPVTKRKRFFDQEESSESKAKSPENLEIDSDAIPLTFICDICVDEKPMIELFRIKGCTHVYCSECMAKYVASKLQENITSITCPDLGCSNGRLDPEACLSMLPPEVFHRWCDALCEASILASQKFYCPYKDCSALLIDDGNGNGGDHHGTITSTECPYCNRLICAQCKVPWHSEISCVEFQKLNRGEREKEDIMMMKLANEKRWKRCPNCGVYISKTMGCNHMVCRCGTNFDYGSGSQFPDIYTNVYYPPIRRRRRNVAPIGMEPRGM